MRPSGSQASRKKRTDRAFVAARARARICLDGRLALWCASSSDVQQMLATSRLEQFFVSPYVGHLGWIGVRLDRDLSWDEIEGVINDAHQVITDKMPRPRAAKAPSAAKARRAPST